MMSSLRKSIISGTIWSVGGQILYLSVILLTNIWLARVLSPDEFGQIGIIMFFITISNSLIESGLGGALVRKKDKSAIDYSTVFILNLVVSIFCFLILLMFSSSIATFYEDLALKNLLIASGAILIVNAFQIVQRAKVVSEMKFKLQSFFKLASVLLGSIVGVVSAYNDCGTWSLVYMNLTGSISLTLFYWIAEGISFSIKFSKKSFRELYSFGVNTTLASFLNTIFDNVYQLVLGKYFNVGQVGLYYQAKRLQDVPGGIIDMVSQNVIFSGLAQLQDDKKSFIEVYNKISLIFIVVLGFISCFIYVYSEQIVLILLGDKWLDAAFFMQMLTIASFFYYQERINKVIFKVFNKTHQILYLEFFKKGIQIISIIIGIKYMDVNLLMIGFIMTSIIGYGINYYFSRKVLGINNKHEIVVFLKVMLISIISIFIIYFINRLISGIYTQLITVPFLIILYFGGLYVLNIFNVFELINKVRD